MPVDWVMQNWELTLGISIVAVLGIATYFEHESGQSYRETGTNVKDKTSNATGGILGFGLVIVMGLIGAAQAAGMTVVGFVLDLFGASPEVFGGIVVALLGALGLEGTLQLSGLQYLGLALIIIGLTVGIANERKMRGARR